MLEHETEDKSATGTTKEKATPNERYLVSRARIRFYVHSPEGEVMKFDEMSFQDQLQFAQQRKSLPQYLREKVGKHLPVGRTGIGSKVQDGASDPFQDTDCDPWKGKGPRHEERPKPEEEAKNPEEFLMHTPPRSQRASKSPNELAAQPGQTPTKAMADKQSFMNRCQVRLRTVY